MQDLNRCDFIGRLGKDPESKSLPSGAAVTNFSIACGSKWKDKDSGEQKERTEWVNIVAFGKLGEICAQYLKKGAQVYVSGEFRTRKWEKDGVTRYSTEVVIGQMQMLGSKQDGAKRETRQPEPAATPGGGGSTENWLEDDDIPFITRLSDW